MPRTARSTTRLQSDRWRGGAPPYVSYSWRQPGVPVRGKVPQEKRNGIEKVWRTACFPMHRKNPAAGQSRKKIPEGALRLRSPQGSSHFAADRDEPPVHLAERPYTRANHRPWGLPNRSEKGGKSRAAGRASVPHGTPLERIATSLPQSCRPGVRRTWPFPSAPSARKALAAPIQSSNRRVRSRGRRVPARALPPRNQRRRHSPLPPHGDGHSRP